MRGCRKKDNERRFGRAWNSAWEMPERRLKRHQSDYIWYSIKYRMYITGNQNVIKVEKEKYFLLFWVKTNPFGCCVMTYGKGDSLMLRKVWICVPWWVCAIKAKCPNITLEHFIHNHFDSLAVSITVVCIYENQ